jgi:esterase
LLHSSVMGEGQPLLLLHGLFGMGDNLSMVARPLAEFFQVYRLDLPNHGRSPRRDSMSHKEMAADVLAFMDEKGLEQVSLLGHSLGGKVAMQLALDHPQRVSRLVVADIAPVEYPPGHNAIFAGLNAIDLSALSSRRDADDVLKQYIDDSGVRLFILKNLYRGEQGLFDWRINIPVIEACYEQIREANFSRTPYEGPTLFIKGGDSDYIQAGHRSAVEALFPCVQLKIIQNTGHWLHAEKPLIFNNLSKRFLLERNAKG